MSEFLITNVSMTGGTSPRPESISVKMWAKWGTLTLEVKGREGQVFESGDGKIHIEKGDHPSSNDIEEALEWLMHKFRNNKVKVELPRLPDGESDG